MKEQGLPRQLQKSKLAALLGNTREQHTAYSRCSIPSGPGTGKDSIRPLGQNWIKHIITILYNVYELLLGHLQFGPSVGEAQFVFLFCSRLTSIALLKRASELSSRRFSQRRLNWKKTKHKRVSKASIKTSEVPYPYMLRLMAIMV